MVAEYRREEERDGQRVVSFIYGLGAIRVAVLLGEICHQLRSSLDNAIFAMSSNQACPREISFPVCDGLPTAAGAPHNGGGACNGTRYSYIPARAKLEIYKLQACRGPGRAVDHPLHVLDTLWNIDKHRRMNVVTVDAELTEPMSVRIVYGPIEPSDVEVRMPGKLPAHQFELFRYTFQPDCQIEITGKFDVGMRLREPDIGIWSGMDPVDIGGNLYAWVAKALEALEPVAL